VEKAIEQLKAEGGTTSVAHYDMRFCKPLDEELLQSIAAKFKRIITIEDAQRTGGFGSAVLEWMSDNDKPVKVVRMGIPDRFIEHGTVPELHHIAGIDVEAIKARIKNVE